MGVIGFAALIANGGVAFMLYRFRGGDANMRSVWICSRNDAIGNFAVLFAAMGVFGTGTGWPDVIVAAIMGGLGLWGGWQIVRQARGELRGERAAPFGVAAKMGSLVAGIGAGEAHQRDVAIMEYRQGRRLRAYSRRIDGPGERRSAQSAANCSW